MSLLKIRTNYIGDYLIDNPETAAVVDATVYQRLMERRKSLINRVVLSTDLDMTEIIDRCLTLTDLGCTFDTIVGFGGGRAIDTAKHLANIQNIDLVVIPTGLSTMAPFNDRAFLYDYGAHRYEFLITPEPTEFIFDNVLLDPAVKSNIRGIASIAAGLIPEGRDDVDASLVQETAEILKNFNEDVNKDGWWRPIREGMYFAHDNLFGLDSMSYVLANYFILEHNMDEEYYSDLLCMAVSLYIELFNEQSIKPIFSEAVEMYMYPNLNTANTIIPDFDVKRFLAFTRLNGTITPLEQYDIYT